MITKALIPAAGYLRMSDDRQEASPDRQRREIEALAERGGYRIVEWYLDEGISGAESRKRKGLQKMLADAKAARFSAILMFEQSRMSREHFLDAAAYWRDMRDAGVRLVTCTKGEIGFDDFASMLTAIVEQHGAREELVKLSQRVISGQRRNIEKGKRLGGRPFGYDREVYDDQGRLVRRVSFREKFRKPPGWTTKLVISEDSAAVEAVRFMFGEAASGAAIANISLALNRKGIKPTRGQKFCTQTVMAILTNPVYIGTLRIGKYASGRFGRLTEDLIEVAGANPAIVSEAQFNLAQAAISSRLRLQKRRSEAGRYLLPRCRCAHCGGPTYGAMLKSSSGDVGCYRCTPIAGHEKQCKVMPCVPAIYAEQGLLSIIHKFLGDHQAGELAQAAARAKKKSQRSASHAQLDALNAKIEKATDNMALAEDEEEYRAIAGRIKTWKSEAAAIKTDIATRSQKEKESAAVLATITSMQRCQNEFARKGNRQRIATALAATIESITLREEQVGRWGVVVATVRPFPDICESGDVQYLPALGSCKMRWLEILFSLYREGPQTVRQLAQKLPIEWWGAREQVAKLAYEGFVSTAGNPKVASLTASGRAIVERYTFT